MKVRLIAICAALAAIAAAFTLSPGAHADTSSDDNADYISIPSWVAQAVTAETNDGTVVLRWDPGALEAAEAAQGGYFIYRKAESGNYEGIGVVPKGELTFEDAPGAGTFEYRLVVYVTHHPVHGELVTPAITAAGPPASVTVGQMEPDPVVVDEPVADPVTVDEPVVVDEPVSNPVRPNKPSFEVRDIDGREAIVFTWNRDLDLHGYDIYIDNQFLVSAPMEPGPDSFQHQFFKDRLATTTNPITSKLMDGENHTYKVVAYKNRENQPSLHSEPSEVTNFTVE